MILKILDNLRIIIFCIAFFFGYRIGFSNGYDPFAQLHFMIPVIIVAIAGISGLNHAVDAIKRKNYKWQNINLRIESGNAIP